MKKKIIGIFVVMLLITTVILPVTGSSEVHKIKASNYELKTEVRKLITFTNYENGDVLDQNQSDYCGWGWTVWGPDFMLAQSYKSTLNIISRVELLLYLVGTPGKLEISIRSELSGPDLTSIIVNGTNISGFQEHWAEFDFPDIGVEPEQTYYIIWSTIDSDSTNYFVWGYGDYNPYDRGDAYTYTPADGWRINEGTENHPDIDFCFRTYGIHNNPPNKPTCSYDRSNDELVISATDPDENQVRYGIDWDNDKIVDQWTDFVGSGTEQRIDCSGRKGTVGVIAEDEYGAQSDWISVKSKYKLIEYQNLNWFFDRFVYYFPFFEKILKQIT